MEGFCDQPFREEGGGTAYHSTPLKGGQFSHRLIQVEIVSSKRSG